MQEHHEKSIQAIASKVLQLQSSAQAVATQSVPSPSQAEVDEHAVPLVAVVSTEGL